MAARDVSFFEVRAHVGPVVCIVEGLVRLVEAKMTEGIMRKLEQSFPQSARAGDDQAVANVPQALRLAEFQADTTFGGGE
jgi:hypothetical protein